jgi:DNA polymerase-3 subunit chi
VTQVDFYVIQNEPAGRRNQTVCQITHKAFRLGHRIYILTANAQHAAELDRLLWTFNAGSFIPHELRSPETTDLPPVLIGPEEPPMEFNDVLISLTPEVPEYVSRFQRVAEIVDNDEMEKQLARARFRYYRDRGYSLNTHNL